MSDTPQRPAWIRKLMEAKPHLYGQDATMSPDVFDSLVKQAVEQLYDITSVGFCLDNEWFEAYPPNVIQTVVWMVVRFLPTSTYFGWSKSIYSVSYDGPCDDLAEAITVHKAELGLEKAEELEQKVADVREALAVIEGPTDDNLHGRWA